MRIAYATFTPHLISRVISSVCGLPVFLREIFCKSSRHALRVSLGSSAKNRELVDIYQRLASAQNMRKMAPF